MRGDEEKGRDPRADSHLSPGPGGDLHLPFHQPGQAAAIKAGDETHQLGEPKGSDLSDQTREGTAHDISTAGRWALLTMASGPEPPGMFPQTAGAATPCPHLPGGPGQRLSLCMNLSLFLPLLFAVLVSWTTPHPDGPSPASPRRLPLVHSAHCSPMNRFNMQIQLHRCLV